jgi:hypothetical protein
MPSTGWNLQESRAMKPSTLVAITFAAVFGAVPVLAQTQAGNRPKIGTATINPTGIPLSQRNPLLADSGAVRIGKLIGTAIYNRNDKKIGSVDDLLAHYDQSPLARDGTPT